MLNFPVTARIDLYRAAWSPVDGYDVGCLSVSDVAVEQENLVVEPIEQSATSRFVEDV